MIENDWLDHEFIDDAHRRLRRGRRARASEWTPATHGRGDRHRRAGDPPGGRVWGTAKTSFLMHARGIEHHSHGVQNVLGAINIVLASGRIGRPRLRLRTITGQAQRPGRPRARPEVRPAPRRARHREPRAPRATSPASGASTRRSCPGPASTPTRCSARSTRGEIKGLLSICFNPVVSLPDNAVRHADAREARVLRRDRLLPERDRPARRRRPARLAARGGRGHGHAGRGARHQDQQGGRLPRRGAAGLAHHPGHRRARSAAPHGLHVRRARARSSRSCGVASKGGVADYSGITYEKIERRWASSGRARTIRDRRADRPPGHAAAVRAGLLEPGREGRRAVLLPRRQGALQRRRLPRRRPRTSTPSIRHPDHRPGGQPVPVRHADAAHRPAGRPVPRAAPRDAPAARRRSSASPTATGRRSRRAAARSRCARMVVTTIRPDTVFIPYHWAGRQERQPADDRRAGPDLEDPRVQGLRGAASARPTAPPEYAERLEPQQ